MLKNVDLYSLRGRARSIGEWSRAHWISVIVGILTLFVVEQVVVLPYHQVAMLATRNPGETAFMRERADRAKREGRQFKMVQHWLSLADIPSDVVNAIIVAEDGTFWSNHGFDWYEVRESVERDLEEGRAARGASTITQQLVKNLYLSPSKNPLRKLKEWILTWWMERKLSKSRILEVYLNVIELGDGVYGIDAASWYHFGKPAELLTREEGARLAAIIPDPRDYMAASDSPYVVRRSSMILDRMEARGY